MDPLDALDQMDPDAIQARIDDLVQQAAMLRQLLRLVHQWQAWKGRTRRPSSETGIAPPT